MWVEHYNFYYSGVLSLGFPFFGFIFLAIGIVGIVYTKKGIWDIPYFILYSWIGFFTLWIVGAMYNVGFSYFSNLNAMLNKQYNVVEGIVENFDPMPPSGHQMESFTVNNVKFEYSDYSVNVGFNNAKSHGGPIDEGKYVKIYYYQRTILRLWIKE